LDFELIKICSGDSCDCEYRCCAWTKRCCSRSCLHPGRPYVCVSAQTEHYWPEINAVDWY